MGKIMISNPYLSQDEPDFLAHFGITCTEGVLEYFRDVKFVCMSGSPTRIRVFAETFSQETGIEKSENLSKTDRYVMYKTGKVLWVNHGMGNPSLSIMLSELIKLFYYSQATDVTFIRIGTSGGIGVEPGTVVVSSSTLNGLLENSHILHILGQEVKVPAILDQNLCDILYNIGQNFDFSVVKGATVSTDDFYEGQARLNGPFCDYTKEDKAKFLNQMYDLGVRNMEMEGTCFAATTHRVGIRGGIVCATFVDRLQEDLAKINQAPLAFQEFEMRPYKVVAAFLKQELSQDIDKN